MAGTVVTGTRDTQPASLAEVLAYRQPHVVHRYAKDHGVPAAEAEELFRETLKWLYLCSRSAEGTSAGFPCVMTYEIVRIDEMWHTFILFTRDYADFCDRYFGGFLHHAPETDDPAPVDQAPDRRAHLQWQFGLVHDLLGEDTLRAWYEERRYARPDTR